MQRETTTRKAKADTRQPTAPPFSKAAASARTADPERHVFGKGFVCDTETRGHATSRGRSPLEIVVDASEGFIPLWANHTTLRWRFREPSLNYFEDPHAAKIEIRKLFGEALLAWGSAAPVKFTERVDAWDFEVVMRKTDDCDVDGCVLASAFFPDAGRHKLVLYPELFNQSRKEQLATLVHEIGHIFGLRHFFADVDETEWPSQVFGKHKPFSIMNYGSKSVLTSADKSDLTRLYRLAWKGELTEINRTPIRFVHAFHTTGTAAENVIAVGQFQPMLEPLPRAAYRDRR